MESLKNDDSRRGIVFFYCSLFSSPSRPAKHYGLDLRFRTTVTPEISRFLKSWTLKIATLQAPTPPAPDLPVLLLLLQLSLLFKAQLRRLLAFLDPLAFLFHNILLSNGTFFSLRSMPIIVKEKCQFSTPSLGLTQ